MLIGIVQLAVICAVGWGKSLPAVPRTPEEIEERQKPVEWSDSVEKTHGDAHHALQEAHSMPPKMLGGHYLEKKFLREHRVYVSVTTSPKRLGLLPYAIESLDLTHVESVFVVIPERFSRDASVSTIPPRLLENPKIRIMYTADDAGPIGKMLVASEYLRQVDPTAYVIAVDDDVCYVGGLVNDLIAQAVLDPHAVHAARITRFTEGPELPSVFGPLIEGVGGTMYPVEVLNLERLRSLSQVDKNTSKVCYLSDDLLFSFLFVVDGIEVFPAPGRAGVPLHFVNLPSQYGPEAMWAGGGIQEAGFTEVNDYKFGQCLAFLASLNLQPEPRLARE